ncbi:hypothetical protein [Variovorax sp. PDC80]|uniref:hypothetical protein n=1 Tax=Variovorax sp. PDC80 TaxID=1882827 RepID=UPI001160B0C9|nr:hypothetical protein [Variovorax sp. PDC80]
MRALALSTRFRKDDAEGDACLLVYDETDLSSAMVSSDVRDVLNARPNTWKIYVVAPFLDEEKVVQSALEGSAFERAAGKIGALVGRPSAAEPMCLHFIHRNEATGEIEAASPAADELIQGWLFSLFDQCRALVDAPAGIHFGKGSGKHARHFLRASNVLLSSAACGFVGLATLARLSVEEPRRIFVDTAPLITVAQAMQRIACALGHWKFAQPVISFSSYGGIDRAPTMGYGDLSLVSASTSGSLADRLVDMGISADNVITLFQLKDPSKPASRGKVVCDLTAGPKRTFGYKPIESHLPETCPSCIRGDILAELAGDQFMLEKRAIKRLRVSTASQKKDARAFFERHSRTGQVRIQPYAADGTTTLVSFDIDLLSQEAETSQAVVRLLRRFTPSPLHVIVLVDIREDTAQRLFEQAGMLQEFEAAVRIGWEQLQSLDPVDRGSMLVLTGCLNDHGRMRGINATMRTKAPQGNVAYLSIITLADSPRNLGDLRMFLSYGQHGGETFIVRSAYDLMLPWHREPLTAWDAEVELLQRIASDDTLAPELEARLARLVSMSSESREILLPGSNGDLAIAADFVYLDTDVNLAAISQADVLAVVSNLLATVRCNDVALPAAHVKPAGEDIQWNQTLYGQVLLSPATLCARNMRDYNDSILRAAFLRMAFAQELDFSIDEHISREVLDVVLAELAGWPSGRGNALPEWLLSMACERLRLHSFHTPILLEAVRTAELPEWLAQLAGRIRSD